MSTEWKSQDTSVWFEVEMNLHRDNNWRQEDDGAPGERRRWSLRITDKVSGGQVAEIAMSDVEMSELLSNNGAVSGSANWAPPEVFGRIGLYSWNASIALEVDPDGQDFSGAEERMWRLIDEDSLSFACRAARAVVRKQRDAILLLVRGYSRTPEMASKDAGEAACELVRYAERHGLRTKSGKPAYFPTRKDVELGRL